MVSDRQRRRVVITLSLAAFVAVAAILLKNSLTKYVENIIEHEAAKQLQGELEIGSLTLNMLRPTVTVRAIKLTSQKFGIENLTVDNAKIRVRPFPMFLGRVIIDKIELGETIVEAVHPSPALLARREPGLKNVLSTDVQFLKFEVRRILAPSLALKIKHKEEEWRGELTVENVDADLDGSAYDATFNFRGDLETTQKLILKPFAVNNATAAMRIGPKVVFIDKLQATTSFGDVQVTGGILPKLDVSGSGSITLDGLTRYPAQGAANFETTIQGSMAFPNISLDVNTQSLTYKRLALGRIVSRLKLAPQNLQIDRLGWLTQFGQANLSGNLKLGDGGFKGRVLLDRFESKKLTSLLLALGIPTPVVRGALSGTIELEGDNTLSNQKRSFVVSPSVTSPEIAIERESGPVVLKNVTLNSEASGSPNENIWAINRFKLQSNEINAEGLGTYATTYYQFEGRASAFNVWQQVSPAFEQVDGLLDMSGRILHRKKEHVGEVLLASKNLKIGKYKDLELAGTMNILGKELQFPEVKLVGEGIHLRSSGSVQLAEEVYDGVNIDLKKAPLKLLANFLPLDSDRKGRVIERVAGNMSGRAAIRGAIDRPSGEFSLNLKEAVLYGESLEEMSLKGKMSKGDIAVDSFNLRKGKGMLKGFGELSPADSSIALSFESTNLRSTDFASLRDFIPGALPIDFQGQLSGDIGNPGITSILIVQDQKSYAPIVNGRITGEINSPKIYFELVDKRSWFSYERGLRKTIDVKLTDLDPIAVARKLGHKINPSLSSSISGTARLEQVDKKISGDVDLTNIGFNDGNNKALSQSSVKLRVDDNKMFVSNCRLQGDGTDIQCLDNARVSGVGNLSLLQTFLPWLFQRSEGVARIDLRTSGPLDKLDLDGTISVKQGTVGFKEFPNTFTGIELDAQVKKRTVTVRDLLFRSSEGRGVGRGQIVFGTWGAPDFDLSADLSQFAVRYPKNVPGRVSGSLSFSGPYRNTLLSGDFQLERMRYTSRFDWRSKLLDFSRSKQLRGLNTNVIDRKKGSGRGVNFDLHFKTLEPTITVKNNVADVDINGDFAVVGKFPNVGIKGTFNADSGEVVFRNRNFDIDSGVVRFDDPLDSVPFIDVYASTRVNEYNVSINIRTVDDQVEVDMTSSPPLSETDLVTLLTVGTVSGTLASPQEPSGITEGLALGFVSGTLQDQVEKIGLIDTFQVVPDYSQVNESTELRLLLGKSITRDLGIFYSTDLYNAGINQEVKLQQNINRNFSLLGVVKNNEVNDNVDLGVDLEFSFDF